MTELIMEVADGHTADEVAERLRSVGVQGIHPLPIVGIVYGSVHACDVFRIIDVPGVQAVFELRIRKQVASAAVAQLARASAL